MELISVLQEYLYARHIIFIRKDTLYSKIKIAVGWFEKNIPRTKFYLFTKPKEWCYWNCIRTTEKQAWNGSLLPKSQRPSILHYTINKAASTFTQSVIHELAIAHGLIHVNYQRYLLIGNLNQRNELYNPKRIKIAFNKNGIYYGALRKLVDIPQLNQYRVVLVIRDPRDVLVSQFYSAKFTHPIVNKVHITNREEMRNRTIDEHVLFTTPRFLKTYTEYCDHLVGNSEVLVLKYEDMVANFAQWINQLADHLQLDKHPEIISKIISRTDFSTTKGKIAHKRQVSPGNYKTALKPTTIDTLNQKFSDILTKLEY